MVNHVGEVKRASNGMKMKIVKYKSNKDIDVQFEDGTVVEHRAYSSFITGLIKHPNVKKRSMRLGETSIANNGMKMTIINYRRAVDLDVQFEDGAIVQHRTYRRFKNGQIMHPTIHTSPKRPDDSYKYIGQTALTKEGNIVTIVEYTKRDNITVEFQDGTRLYNQLYRRFINNAISESRNRHAYKKQKEERIGEKVIANNGLEATIIEYKDFRNVTVQFEDGTIIGPVKYNMFKKGVLKHPNIGANKGKRRYNRLEAYRNKYLNKTLTMKNGLKATVIRYDNSNNLTVQFEDGTVRKHISTTDFNRGTVTCKKTQGRVGEQRYNNKGLLMTIVEYKRYSNITVQFEDGTLVNNRSYWDFTKGAIRHPKDRKKEDDCELPIQVSKKASTRVGEVVQANNGMLMELIEYKRYSNVTVRFEDDTVVTNKSYGDFKKGLIKNPTLEVRRTHTGVVDVTNHMYTKARDKYTGMTVQTRCGLSATVIEYGGSDNITVRFEDGVIVTGVSNSNLVAGVVNHPKFKKRSDYYKVKRVGELGKNAAGKQIKIVEYRHYNDIDVEVENEKIVKHTTYLKFKQGKISV